MIYGFVGWVLTGALVGFVISKVVNLHGDDPNMGIICSVLAAILTGISYSYFKGIPVEGFSMSSNMVAAIGSGVALVVFHFVRYRAAARN